MPTNVLCVVWNWPQQEISADLNIPLHMIQYTQLGEIRSPLCYKEA